MIERRGACNPAAVITPSTTGMVASLVAPASANCEPKEGRYGRWLLRRVQMLAVAIVLVVALSVQLLWPALAASPGLSLGDQASSPCMPGAAVASFTASAPPGALLAGIRVRSGQWIDAVTPLFASIQPDGKLSSPFPGQEEGGHGGTAQQDLVRDGYVVAGINRRVGVVLDGVQIIWRRWSVDGPRSATDTASPWIGGTGGQPLEPWTAPDGYAATTLVGYVGNYSGGDQFVNLLCIMAQKATWLGGNMIDLGSLAPFAGLALLLLILFVVLRISHPTDQQFFVIRVVLALAGAGFAAVIPGFLNLEMDTKGIALRAGGALAVFVVLYLFTPKVRLGGTP